MAWSIGPRGDRLDITIEGSPISRDQVRRLRDALSTWLERGDANPFAKLEHLDEPRPHVHERDERRDVVDHASQHTQVNAWIVQADARLKKLEDRVFDERAAESDDFGWPEVVFDFLEKLGGKR